MSTLAARRTVVWPFSCSRSSYQIRASLSVPCVPRGSAVSPRTLAARIGRAARQPCPCPMRGPRLPAVSRHDRRPRRSLDSMGNGARTFRSRNRSPHALTPRSNGQRPDLPDIRECHQIGYRCRCGPAHEPQRRKRFSVSTRHFPVGRPSSMPMHRRQSGDSTVKVSPFQAIREASASLLQPIHSPLSLPE